MSTPAKPRESEPKAAASARGRGTLESTVNPTASQGAIRVPAPAGQHKGAGEQREETPSFAPQTSDAGAATAPAIPSATFSTAPAAAADEPTAIVRTQAETVIHRTMEAVERLRTTGGERVEVKIRLDAGNELTVRLQLTHGEIRPVFLTESRELRQAIEQNWAQFSERTSERTVRVTTPVFESPNSQSGMNDLSQQQREGRQRAFAEAQEEIAGRIPAGRNSQRRMAAPVASAAPAAGVQLYA